MGTAKSPQAHFPEFRTVEDHIKDITVAKPSQIQPPRVIGLGAANQAIVFDARPPGGSMWADKKPNSKIWMHNVSPYPIKYAVNTTASATVYHDVLAGGNDFEDGLGSGVDLSKEQPDWISVYCASDSGRVCLFVASPKETVIV